MLSAHCTLPEPKIFSLRATYEFWNEAVPPVQSLLLSSGLALQGRKGPLKDLDIELGGWWLHREQVLPLLNAGLEQAAYVHLRQ